MANPEQALALAQAARIQSLEEELVILRDLDRSKGDELDTLRTALQRKEFAYKDLAASERLAQAELAKSAGAAQDLEEVVGAVREELRAAELGLLAEKEARTALGEKLTEQQRQLSEATTKLAKAAAAEQAAREQAAASENAKQLAVADAERARRDSAHAAESTAKAVQEAGFVGEKAQGELMSQLIAAQDLARSQASEVVTLREEARAAAAELASRQERLDAANKLLERTQAERADVSGQLSTAAHEVWEGALQQRLRREESEALEARLRFLEAEMASKDERLRGAEGEAQELRAALRKQHGRMAEAEQTLQKVRVIEVPSMREDLRREESRAAAAEAKLIAVEGQLTAASLSLAESRQLAIDREQAVAQARSLQLAAELRLADADQRVASEARAAAVAQAEARGAADRHAALQDAHTETRAALRQVEEQLSDAEQRERTREEIAEPLARKTLDEAKEEAEVLHASLRGKEERHAMLLETLGALRRALAEREAKVHELGERVSTLETIELVAATEREAAAREAAASANVSTQGAELRLSEMRERFDEAHRQAAELSAQLARADEAKHTAEAQAALREGIAAAAKREAALSAEQLRGEAARSEELSAELKVSREALRTARSNLSIARSEVDAKSDAKEAAEETAALEAQRARATAFDLEMARASLAEEGSKLKLSAAHLAAKDAQITELVAERSAARAKLGARAEHSDELHERMRLAAIAGTENEAELVRLRARVAELQTANSAKDEQIELARSKLRLTAEDGKSKVSAAQTLAERAAAMSEDLRVRDEQISLLQQSISLLEEEAAAKAGKAGAVDSKIKLLHKEVSARDDEILVLSEKLQAAHLEIKVGGSSLGRKNEELTQQLAASQSALALSQKQLEQKLLMAAREAVQPRPKLEPLVEKSAVDGGADTMGFFHNTCLLIKVLLSKHQKVGNLPIDELYDHVCTHAVPIEEWPQFIYRRYTHEPVFVD